jgi:uncharacterized protein YkwD
MLLIGALVLGCPLAARADLRDTVNWARERGCAAVTPRAGGLRAALRDSSRLHEAARLLMNGDSLSAALARADYRAARSSAVHLSGAVSDAQVAHTLTASDCAILTEPRFTEVGAERRGRDVWMVLAAPLAVPNPGTASAVSREILSLVNAARAGGRRCGAKYFAPAAPLIINPALTAAALEHSRDMARHGEFDHHGHDGSTPTMRVQRAGYGRFQIVGENIAAGATTSTEVTQGWLASPAHCENIMDARFSEIGIAFMVNMASAEAIYWTQDFASPRR